MVHTTLDFRSSAHEAASGAAVVTFEPVPLDGPALAARGGGKFKLVEIRSC